MQAAGCLSAANGAVPAQQSCSPPEIHPLLHPPPHTHRHVARAASHEGLQREMAQGGQLHFPACSATPASDGAVAECWDEERMSAEQEGLVVFDGGSYSLGPAAIGALRSSMHLVGCLIGGRWAPWLY